MWNKRKEIVQLKYSFVVYSLFFHNSLPFNIPSQHSPSTLHSTPSQVTSPHQISHSTLPLQLSSLTLPLNCQPKLFHELFPSSPPSTLPLNSPH